MKRLFFTILLFTSISSLKAQVYDTPLTVPVWEMFMKLDSSFTLPNVSTPTALSELNGSLRYNPSTSKFQGRQSGSWTNFINGSQGNLTETTSSVLTITGGTAAVLGSSTTIQVKQASGSQGGFVSSSDWTAFNSKSSLLLKDVSIDNVNLLSSGITLVVNVPANYWLIPINPGTLLMKTVAGTGIGVFTVSAGSNATAYNNLFTSLTPALGAITTGALIKFTLGTSAIDGGSSGTNINLNVSGVALGFTTLSATFYFSYILVAK